MSYSPVRHSPPGSKLPVLPFDLHVLSTPPAFNLSQDQTLLFNHCFCRSSPELKEKEQSFLSASNEARTSVNFLALFRKLGSCPSLRKPSSSKTAPMFTLIGSLNSDF